LVDHKILPVATLHNDTSFCYALVYYIEHMFVSQDKKKEHRQMSRKIATCLTVLSLYKVIGRIKSWNKVGSIDHFKIYRMAASLYI